MVGASVGDRSSISFVASVGRRLGSERRLELGRSHRSGPWSVGAWDTNPRDGRKRFWGFGRFWPRPVGYSEANGIGTSVGCSLKLTASGRRSVFVRYSVGQTTLVCCSGYRSESLGHERRQGVGNNVGRLVSGHRLISVGTSVGLGSLDKARRQAVGRDLFGDSVG